MGPLRIIENFFAAAARPEAAFLKKSPAQVEGPAVVIEDRLTRAKREVAEERASAEALIKEKSLLKERVYAQALLVAQAIQKEFGCALELVSAGDRVELRWNYKANKEDQDSEAGSFAALYFTPFVVGDQWKEPFYWEDSCSIKVNLVKVVVGTTTYMQYPVTSLEKKTTYPAPKDFCKLRGIAQDSAHAKHISERRGLNAEALENITQACMKLLAIRVAPKWSGPSPPPTPDLSGRFGGILITDPL